MEEQNVQVEALVRQTYKGRGYIRGEKFEMTASDADDAVAVRCVLKVPPPVVLPVMPALPVAASAPAVVSREMAPAGTTEEAAPDAQDPAQEATEAETSGPRRSGGPQRPYSHRAMTARKN